MLYCRVVLGKTLEFKTTKADQKDFPLAFLHSMQQPRATDSVFHHCMTRKDAKAKSKENFDTVVVEADKRGASRGGGPVQIHREVDVFDSDQVYPEFLVWYRTDTEDEQLELEQRHAMELEAFLLLAVCVLVK